MSGRTVSDESDRAAADLRDLHLGVGWWSLLVFVAGGLVLETLHAFKVGYYLDASNETRRLLWTLAHAHGTLLALLNLVFALSLGALRGFAGPSRALASRCLLGALVLLPLGFLLGGVFVHGGDPGIGVLLAPPGGLLLVVAVWLTARGARRGAGGGPS